MNYIKHLTGFFDRIVQDRSLNPTHISLYIALFQFWNVNRFQNPISITRDEVMRISKICSKATYHKCMRELNEKGYIKYEPSFNPFKGSMVILFNFSEDLKPVQKRVSTSEKFLPITEQLVNKQGTSSETSTEQVLVPSINYINNTNISNDLNLQTQAENFENEVNFLEKENIKKEMPERIVNEKEKLSSLAFADYKAKQTENSQQKSSAKKEKIATKDYVTSSVSSRAQSKDEKPAIENIKAYFIEQNFPELEAQKFFNYFSSIGWLVGGKTPMVDWQASAQNWMINSLNFNHNTITTPIQYRQNTNATTNKDYSEPL